MSMSNKFITSALSAGVLCFLALSAVAQTTTATTPAMQEEQPPVAVSSDRLVSRYSSLSGSTRNAQSLVTGLQSGSSITLVPTGAPSPANQPVTFTPATPHLGLGEVNITLSLAKAELSKLGITNPTPAQLQAALNGGTLTAADGSSVKLAGVLAQRQSGQGWGQIANSMGVKLGSLVSASKTGHADSKAEHEESGAMHAARADDASAHGKSNSTNTASHANGNGGGKSSGGGGGGNGGGGGGGGKK
jgi:hypothetical protein